ncbi:MAG: hypothetical protein ACHREM_06600 [Polyangiales bacterium]
MAKRIADAARYRRRTHPRRVGLVDACLQLVEHRPDLVDAVFGTQDITPRAQVSGRTRRTMYVLPQTLIPAGVAHALVWELDQDVSFRALGVSKEASGRAIERAVEIIEIQVGGDKPYRPQRAYASPGHYDLSMPMAKAGSKVRLVVRNISNEPVMFGGVLFGNSPL